MTGPIVAVWKQGGEYRIEFGLRADDHEDGPADPEDVMEGSAVAVGMLINAVGEMADGWSAEDLDGHRDTFWDAVLATVEKAQSGDVRIARRPV